MCPAQGLPLQKAIIIIAAAAARVHAYPWSACVPWWPKVNCFVLWMQQLGSSYQTSHAHTTWRTDKSSTHSLSLNATVLMLVSNGTVSSRILITFVYIWLLKMTSSRCLVLVRLCRPLVNFQRARWVIGKIQWGLISWNHKLCVYLYNMNPSFWLMHDMHDITLSRPICDSYVNTCSIYLDNPFPRAPKLNGHKIGRSIENTLRR